MEPEGSGIPVRLGHLFETLKNPRTGEPYTNAEVARTILARYAVGAVELVPV